MEASDSTPMETASATAMETAAAPTAMTTATTVLSVGCVWGKSETTKYC
jgi:cyclopropane fatty-acyl-phospholipid synthase-like methyltransferase